MTALDERFMSKVVVSDSGCWEWTANTGSQGYGLFSVSGRNRNAHRYAYEQMVGPVPDGLVLDHFACDNRGCVNPAHVRPVTPRENALRGDSTQAAVNLAKTHCKNGHLFDAANTRVTPSGWRQCRACHRAEVAAYEARRRAS